MTAILPITDHNDQKRLKRNIQQMHLLILEKKTNQIVLHYTENCVSITIIVSVYKLINYKVLFDFFHFQ